MKKTLFTCLMLVVSLGMYAQEETNLLTSRATALNRNYLRPSMSRIFVTDGSSTAKVAAERLLAMPDLKFDQNEVSKNLFTLSSIPGDNTRDSVVKAQIEKIIVDQKIGNQIMKNWFPKFIDEKEGYGIDALMTRGQFAATDNDVLKSNASQRQTVLNELGLSLIDRSYAVFYLIKDASYTDKNGKRHENVKMIPYVYKLDYSPEVQADFYNNYYTKANGIDQANFPLQFIMNANSGVSANPNSVDETDYEDLMTIIGKKVADFQVKTPVVGTNPVRAKIGTKEGVKIDKRYAIMEYRQDKNGNEYAKRIATVRANKIADNNKIATGNSEELSKFYYIKGSPAHEGMTIVENPDFGISVDAQYNVAGFNASIAYRLGRLMNAIPGFQVYINLGLANDEDGKLMKVMAVTKKDAKGFDETVVLRGGVGIAKEFNFARNFVLTPNVGIGVLWPVGAKELKNMSITRSGNTVNFKADYDPETASLDSYYLEGSVKLGYMATREVQVFAEAGYNVNILGDQFKFMRDYYYLKEGEKAKDPRKLRIGGGVKVYF